MIQVSIQYPNREGARFDADYYVNRHMPMTKRLLSPALRDVTVVLGVSAALPGDPPPYVAACFLLFDTAQAFYDAFVPHMEQLQGDIPAYTDIAPVIQIGEVRPVS